MVVVLLYTKATPLQFRYLHFQLLPPRPSSANSFIYEHSPLRQKVLGSGRIAKDRQCCGSTSFILQKGFLLFVLGACHRESSVFFQRVRTILIPRYLTLQYVNLYPSISLPPPSPIHSGHVSPPPSTAPQSIWKFNSQSLRFLSL